MSKGILFFYLKFFMKLNIKIVFTGLVFLLPLAACAEVLLAIDDKDGATKPPFDLSDTSRINIGKKRFNSVCAAYCHGAEGDGGKVTAFKGNAQLTPEIIYKTILEGRRGADIMPPWGRAFSSEEIWELTAYVSYLTKQPPIIK